MKYVATLISLAMALAPVTLADVHCCMKPTENVPKINCNYSFYEPACCTGQLFKSCGRRANFKWTVDSPNYDTGASGTPGLLQPCKGGGQVACVKLAIPPPSS
ncbi:hypothetical protein COCVIDRAFT_21267 [Bipolaris victoriae FI3]|uniref:Uncharacterized protein n=1 Tax=Bipolaris victoriae (strain FI3) TaxID=930091 RepID=W7DQV2_BIPV3|nr:hypothetical protein COCVIDRAFT_21267 [Bipolaris victoriae FI3]